MSLPAEVADNFFGELELVDESAYACEVSWNRDLAIRVFIHIEGQNYREVIENAKEQFLLVREKEEAIFEEGAGRTSLGEHADDFLDSALDTSIEIYPNGSGTLVYLVMMGGTLIIELTPDCNCGDAQFLPG